MSRHVLPKTFHPHIYTHALTLHIDTRTPSLPLQHQASSLHGQQHNINSKPCCHPDVIHRESATISTISTTSATMIAACQPMQMSAAPSISPARIIQRSTGRPAGNMTRRPQPPPGPRPPPQPREGEAGRCLFSSNASLALRRGDPQPREGETGRTRYFLSSSASSASRRGDPPQPRDPGNGRRNNRGGNDNPKDPNPRDPGT